MAEILILSAGRRVSLVRAFKSACHRHNLQVTAADMDPRMSSACHVADKRLVLPHVTAPEYAEKLIDYCRQNGVRLVIPTIDTELLQLAKLRSALAEVGCTAIVCDEALVEICRDKRQTARFFERMGLKSPKIYPLDEIKYPAFVKPFDGSLSTGIAVLKEENDLTNSFAENPKNIFCQYLNPSEYAEYTCDAYFNRNGRIICVVPRLRIQVRGGEVAKGRAERNDIVPLLFEKLAKIEGARGCLTIQFMRHKVNEEIYLIEVNPRFGGGYPLSAEAGAAYHDWLLSEYIFNQEIPVYDDWRDGLTMLRYDAEVFLVS